MTTIENFLLLHMTVRRWLAAMLALAVLGAGSAWEAYRLGQQSVPRDLFAKMNEEAAKEVNPSLRPTLTQAIDSAEQRHQDVLEWDAAWKKLSGSGYTDRDAMSSRFIEYQIARNHGDTRSKADILRSVGFDDKAVRLLTN
jgi:hypothetical protein